MMTDGWIKCPICEFYFLSGSPYCPRCGFSMKKTEMTELDCLRILAPLASPDTRRYVHETMLRVKKGERNVPIKRFAT